MLLLDSIVCPFDFVLCKKARWSQAVAKKRAGSKPKITRRSCGLLSRCPSSRRANFALTFSYTMERSSMQFSWILRFSARRSPERFVLFVIINCLLTLFIGRRLFFLLSFSFYSYMSVVFLWAKVGCLDKKKSCKIGQKHCKILHSSYWPILQNRSWQPHNSLYHNNLAVTCLKENSDSGESSSPREKNTPFRNEKEFYGVKIFLFPPKMRPHFWLKNKKVSGKEKTTF